MADRKVAFVLTEAQYEQIEMLKQKSYYNKSYSDLLRFLVDEGIEAVNKKEKRK